MLDPLLFFIRNAPASGWFLVLWIAIASLGLFLLIEKAALRLGKLDNLPARWRVSMPSVLLLICAVIGGTDFAGLLALVAYLWIALLPFWLIGWRREVAALLVVIWIGYFLWMGFCFTPLIIPWLL